MSRFGNLRSGTKSDLRQILEIFSTSPIEATSVVKAIRVDFADLVNILRPNGACKTFSDYAS